MAASWTARLRRLPILIVTAAALYLVFHFPLVLLYSAVGEIWSPLAVAIPVGVLYVVYRRPLLQIHHRNTFAFGKLLYWAWTIFFALGLGGLTWLVDKSVVIVAVIGAALAVFFFPRKRARWLALAAFAATLLAPVWREPWLVSTWGRQAFGAVLLGSMAVLFATTELRRIKAIEFGTMVLLAPLVFTLFAFYRAPEKPPTGDARVRFLYSSTDAKAPARVRRGDDLRFAARDCRGRLLLGGASSPGLEILDGRSAVLDPAPTGDNLLPICVGRPGLAYGARDGSVIWQGDDGERKTFAMGQPVLMVQYDPRRDLIFAMNRLTRLVSLRLSDFDLVAQHAGGVSIDILYSPEQDVLYRSVFLRGVETLEPQTLEVIGVRELPLSVGGTMAVDPAHRRLFLTDWLGGTLYVLDARDLTPAAELPADHGMRRVVFDRQRELLLAGSYFRGDVLVYRPNIGGPPLRLHVGRRVRELALDGDRCLGVSAAGVFALDLNAIARGFGR